MLRATWTFAELGKLWKCDISGVELLGSIFLFSFLGALLTFTFGSVFYTGIVSAHSSFLDIFIPSFYRHLGLADVFYVRSVDI